MSGTVFPLHGRQADAVDPRESVWLSASAGTGKTQVLSARVLRLLLQQDVQPSQLLCLTFTKAGAAEMALRVNEVLANWVRMPESALREDLAAIGADASDVTVSRARTLFASVLDCPGGGLRIDTIHAFAQYLLATFPEEAGLAPGAKAMEDRDRDLLARDVLTDMLVEAQQGGDTQVLAAIEEMSLAKGADAVLGWLMRCAGAMDLWQGPGAWQPPFRDRVNRLLGLEADASEADLAALCSDDIFDHDSLRGCMEAHAGWSAKSGQEGATKIGGWLALDAAGRLERLDDLTAALMTQKGDPRNPKSLEKIDPYYLGYWSRVAESIQRVRDMRALLALAEFLTPALSVGRKFALLWDEAKQREGFVDFDDQIRLAARLLNTPGLSDWIRFKLDRRFDHVLIDEAQDTNEAQWDIIFALIGEYFSGEGARDGKMRTVFTVGDYKQAIFRFQGTSPENFEAAKRRVQAAMAGAAANAAELRASHDVRELRDYGLAQSFRTSEKLLEFVDVAIARIGWDRFGLKDKAEPHVGQDRPGLVALWPPVSDEIVEENEGDEQQDNWLSRPDRKLADKIARQVRAWMDEGFPLAKGRHRNAGPGDVMVLVRKRKELAGLIVARLHAAGVPVAGVDRLRLGGPLAVKDLMAAMRFAVQPLDDLNLANLLVSPLVGWSQEDLLAWAYREDSKVPLWNFLRDSARPEVGETCRQLRELLALADFEPPQALLHWMLVGPWGGRRRLVGRLGHEANDPIDELLNAAHAYAAAHAPSLQGFIQWFDMGEGELKREAGASAGLVRVMTVHGAKGLQAPIVILADAADNPDYSRPSGFDLVEPRLDGAAGRKVPLPGLSRDQKVGPVLDAELAVKKAEREEHWRLLYVAMTRAEEALFVAGSLGSREREKGPAPESWFASLAPLFEQEPVADPIWDSRHEWGELPPKLTGTGAGEADAGIAAPALPGWALQPVGPEPRPPRPLSPSAAGEDLAPDPPLPSGVLQAAAKRGVLLHKLLERLPQAPPETRETAAQDWLERQAGEIDPGERGAMIEAALAVLAAPEWAELFGPGSLAEVPIAAVVGGQVIAGTVDRLLVTPQRVVVVDYKTSRRPPRDESEIMPATLRQMAAYQAALEAIYPGRSVEVAVLYTHSPQIFALSDAMLAPHKAVLQGAQ